MKNINLEGYVKLSLNDFFKIQRKIERMENNNEESQKVMDSYELAFKEMRNKLANTEYKLHKVISFLTKEERTMNDWLTSFIDCDTRHLYASERTYEELCDIVDEETLRKIAIDKMEKWAKEKEENVTI